MDKVIDRIKKLLELSRSDNEHEAAVAAAKAAELMMQHQISEATLHSASVRDEPVVEEMIDKDGKVVEWHAVLVHGLAASMGAFMYARPGARGGYKASYQVVGTKAVIDAVRYMYSYLTGEIDRLSHAAYAAECHECVLSGLPGPGNARGWKTSFRFGAAKEVRARLLAKKEEQRVAAQADHSQALLVLDKKREEIEAYVKTHHPKLTSSYTYAGRTSVGGFSAGQQAGKAINLGGNNQVGAGNRQLKS